MEEEELWECFRGISYPGFVDILPVKPVKNLPTLSFLSLFFFKLVVCLDQNLLVFLFLMRA